MNYHQAYSLLKNIFNQTDSIIPIPENNLSIVNLDFTSEAVIHDEDFDFLKPAKKLFNALLKYYLRDNAYSKEYLFKSLDESDENIIENLNFKYSIIRNHSNEKSKSVIFLFHGLNERSWHKYLPWAYELALRTGKAIILFPLAFHMNRAPDFWSDPRLMKEVSRERINLLPDVAASSFANSALSTRLQFSPGRFLISGIQTFNDIITLMKIIRNDSHPCISKNAEIDIFGYSIGAFLSEILLMSNPNNYFGSSRMFLFCGGPTLDQMQPVSKAIIDSEAALTLKNYFVDNYEKEFLRDDVMMEILDSYGEEGNNFKSMLEIKRMESFRDSKLHKLKDRLLAVPLIKDSVMSPKGLVNTFGKHSNEFVRIEDFPYEYPHENPFPLNEKLKEAVNFSFNKTFELAGSFLS
ncbi:MAG: DUF6051 family protein [Ignavibacteriaceae bacterium]